MRKSYIKGRKTESIDEWTLRLRGAREGWKERKLGEEQGQDCSAPWAARQGTVKSLENVHPWVEGKSAEHKGRRK